jgi:hypothetical protein
MGGLFCIRAEPKKTFVPVTNDLYIERKKALAAEIVSNIKDTISRRSGASDFHSHVIQSSKNPSKHPITQCREGICDFLKTDFIFGF